MRLKNIFAFSIISAITLGFVAGHFDLSEGKWMIFIVSFLLSFVIAIFIFWYKRSYLFSFIIFWIVLAHFISGIIIINCFFDKSEPIIISEKIINKKLEVSRRNGSSSPNRNFKLFFDNDEIKDIRVSRKLFDSLNKGDYIDVYIKEGLFDFRWYYVDDSFYN